MVQSSLQFESLIDLCRNQHRRIVIAKLANEKRSLAMSDLTKAIITCTHHMPATEVSEKDTREIRLSLHHSHIPKLADYSLIEYDPDRQQVKPRSQFNHVEPHLSSIIDADPDLEAPVTL